jgi:hypothetical protein
MNRTPPIVAEDRSSLTAHTLQPVQRLELLGKHLDGAGRPLLDDSGSRRALFLIGEGGIGKSVLLGQYLDRLDAASLDDSRWCCPWHAKADGLVMDLVSGFRDGDGPAAGPVAGGSTGPGARLS